MDISEIQTFNSIPSRTTITMMGEFLARITQSENRIKQAENQINKLGRSLAEQQQNHQALVDEINSVIAALASYRPLGEHLSALRKAVQDAQEEQEKQTEAAGAETQARTDTEKRQ